MCGAHHGHAMLADPVPPLRGVERTGETYPMLYGTYTTQPCPRLRAYTLFGWADIVALSDSGHTAPDCLRGGASVQNLPTVPARSMQMARTYICTRGKTSPQRLAESAVAESNYTVDSTPVGSLCTSAVARILTPRAFAPVSALVALLCMCAQTVCVASTILACSRECMKAKIGPLVFVDGAPPTGRLITRIVVPWASCFRSCAVCVAQNISTPSGTREGE